MLVVEDRKQLRDFVEIVLRSFGYEVWSAATASEASDLFRLPGIGFVLCDLDLGSGSDGLEFLTRATAERRDLKAILMTGGGDVGAVARSYAVLQKPFGPEELIAVIKGVKAR